MTSDREDHEDWQRRWETILEETDIQTVPIKFLKELSVVMLDGDVKVFNVTELLKSGLKIKQVETSIRKFISTNDNEIDSIYFHLNVDTIAKTVEKHTKRYLGD